MSRLDSVLFHDPANTGGGHFLRQVELMESFAEDDVRTYFVSPPGFDGCSEVNHCRDDLIPFAERLGLLAHLLSVCWYLLTIRPDRFVPFNVFGGLVGGLVTTVCRTETVLFIRGDLYRGRELTGGRRARLLKDFVTAVEWLTFRLVDRIVFISEHNREMMLDRTGLSKSDVDSVVLYNDTLTDRVSDQLAAEPESLDGSPVVGFAGEFPANGGKGVSDLIDAVAILEEELPELHLYLLGRGPGKAQLRSQARRRGVDNRVHMPGWVDNPVQYMMAFDLYVLPSYHEGLGNSLMEALAAETPIAGSNVGGIPEVVFDRTYLFEAANPTDLAAVVRETFDSETSYERAMENCRQRRAAFDFDWTDTARRIVASDSAIDDSDRFPDVEIPDRLGAVHADI